MPQQRIKTLISQLHDLYGDDQASAQQRKLLQDLERGVHPSGSLGPDDPSPVETVDLLLEEFDEEHPRTSAVLRELMDVLKNIGV